MDDFYTRTGTASSTRKGSTLKPILGVAGGAFLLGAAIVGLAGWYGLFDGVQRAPEVATEFVEQSPGDTESDEAAESPVIASEQEVTDAAQAVERVAEQQGGLDQRIVAMEQRLAALDLQTQAAEGNAARAEGLLIAFATRRAIERGAPLGYLEDPLRLRFGEARPDTVRVIIETSRDPVTLDQLLAQLDGLRPQLTRAPGDEEGAMA